jgi:hypothetical protein
MSELPPNAWILGRLRRSSAVGGSPRQKRGVSLLLGGVSVVPIPGRFGPVLDTIHKQLNLDRVYRDVKPPDKPPARVAIVVVSALG